MLSNNTVSKLHEMKLSVMATSFQKQLDDNAVASLSFEERFGLLVDAEWTSRKNNRLKRLIRKADYVFPGACLEDIEYHADRQLDNLDHLHGKQLHRQHVVGNGGDSRLFRRGQGGRAAGVGQDA